MKYYVTCEPRRLELEVEADSRDDAITYAIEEWCPCSGASTAAVCTGSFDVRELEPA